MSCQSCQPLLRLPHTTFFLSLSVPRLLLALPLLLLLPSVLQSLLLRSTRNALHNIQQPFHGLWLPPTAMRTLGVFRRVIARVIADQPCIRVAQALEQRAMVE